VRAVAPLTPDIELQANGLWFDDRRERGTAFSEIATGGADASLRLLGSGRWAWTALGYVQTRDFRNSFASASDDRTSVARVADQYSVPSTGLGARFELRPPLGAGTQVRLGGDWRETAGETRERFSFQNGVGTRGRVAGGQSRTLGLFAEAALERGSLTLTGGGRIDRWRIEDGFLDERVFATGAVLTDTDFPDRSGWEPTGRAGLAWSPGKGLTLRAAAYLGWRLPTLNELYRPFRIGPDATAANAALSPERLKGIEAGVAFEPAPRARVGLTLFANRLEEPIANVTLGRGPGLFPGVGFVAGEFRQRRNLEAIDSRGIELDASLDLGSWSLTGGYSYVDAQVEANGPALPLDGLRPAQTPRHSLAGTIAWRSRRGGSASLSARYVGSQYEDDLNQQLLADALTLDAAASWPLTPVLSLEARGENLTDALVAAGISGDGIVERATPRTLWIGLRLSS
jgi:outer membrane receptor protein involved in Fe transport